MTVTESEEVENLPPVAHVTLTYLGPIAPHWELRSHFGDQKTIDGFWSRVHARLLLLPKHDPQFRRNRERVNRDAERELIVCDWDLGEDDAESTRSVVEPSEVQGSEDDGVSPEVQGSEDDGVSPDDAPESRVESEEQDVIENIDSSGGLDEEE